MLHIRSHSKDKPTVLGQLSLLSFWSWWKLRLGWFVRFHSRINAWVAIKLGNPFKTRAIPECFCNEVPPYKGTISSVLHIYLFAWYNKILSQIGRNDSWPTACCGKYLNWQNCTSGCESDGKIWIRNHGFLFEFISNHSSISLSFGDIRVWHTDRQTDRQRTSLL